ncbi:MAG: hypothetical protein H7Y02_00245, partial [Candidatus Obscuribacterales bacterium]|nr:hypothetical protein [Steroidobacteraceae bacterium]
MFTDSAVILPAMLCLSGQSKGLLVLLCILVVMMRVGGAHVHFCFDGSEPPASLHLDGDGGLHHLDDHHDGSSAHDAVAGVQHSDLDVNLVTDVLLKKTGGLDSLVLLFTFALTLFLFPLIRRLLPSATLLPASSRRAHLRPPLR